jgi:hypothetical protein
MSLTIRSTSRILNHVRSHDTSLGLNHARNHDMSHGLSLDLNFLDLSCDLNPGSA